MRGIFMRFDWDEVDESLVSKNIFDDEIFVE